MSRRPTQPRTRPLPSSGRDRLNRLPGPREIGQFLAQLRHPTHVTAVRSVFDGLFVALTLKTRAARPLLVRSDRIPPGEAGPERLADVSRAVDAGLALLPMNPTCLRRSLTLMRELRRLGLPGRVHIGVRSAADGIEAHAWVQAGDLVINDDQAVTGTYVELAAGELERLPPSLR